MPRLHELRGHHPIAFSIGSNVVDALTPEQAEQRSVDDVVLVERIDYGQPVVGANFGKSGRARLRFECVDYKAAPLDDEAYWRLGYVTLTLALMMQNRRHR